MAMDPHQPGRVKSSGKIFMIHMDDLRVARGTRSQRWLKVDPATSTLGQLSTSTGEIWPAAGREWL